MSIKVRILIISCIFSACLLSMYANVAEAQITQSNRSGSSIEAAKAKAAAIEDSGILEGYSSYQLYHAFIVKMHLYWRAYYAELDKTNALGILAGSLITFSFVLLAFKLYVGKGMEVVWDAAISIGIAIIAIGILTNEALMSTIVFEFCLTLPLKVSSFFMDLTGKSAMDLQSDIWAKNALSSVASVQGVFDGLDSNFSTVWGFWETMAPEGTGVMRNFATFVVVTYMLIMYALIYAQFFVTFVRCSATIVLCAILAPFFGALAVFVPARMKILGLAKTIFYSWLVMIVSTIVVGLFVEILGGLISDIMIIERGANFFVGSFIFMILWCIIGYSLLSSVPSFVSQITEMRGASGGIGAFGMAAGALYMATKVGGAIKGGAMGAFKQGNKAYKSHKEKQKGKQ